jgi:hypothetical protein
MDLRKTKRYPLSAPVCFCWEGAGGILQEGEGTTRDISVRGVFVVTKSPPPPGVLLELDVYPPSPNGVPKSMRLHGEGKVIRVSARQGPESGFAVEAMFQTENSGSPLFGTGGVIQ